MRQGLYSAPKYISNYTNPPVKKWAQDIDCIIKSCDPQKGCLYVSNVQAAQNPLTIKKLKVGSILSCAKGYKLSHPTSLVPYYMYIEGEDKQSFDISKHFDQAVEFIYSTLQKTNVIVHCIAGVSRSVSMVLAYFIKHKSMSYNQAFYQVKSKRKIISPNQGFIQHLKAYQHKLKTTDKTTINSSLVSPIKQFKDIENDELISFKKTSTGSFYTPKKTLQYYRKLQVHQSSKNPQSCVRQDFLKQSWRNTNQNKSPTIYTRAQYKPVQNINSYKKFSKSMSLIPQNQTAINRTQSKQLSPRKDEYFYNTYQQTNNYQPVNSYQLTNTYKKNNSYQQTAQRIDSSKSQRVGYFDAMNKELNDKIAAIKNKYQQQRQQMLKSYGSRADNTKISPQKNIYLRRETPQERVPNYISQPTKESYNTLSYSRVLDSPYKAKLKNMDQPYVPRMSSTSYGTYRGRYY